MKINNNNTYSYNVNSLSNAISKTLKDLKKNDTLQKKQYLAGLETLLNQKKFTYSHLNQRFALLLTKSINLKTTQSTIRKIYLIKEQFENLIFFNILKYHKKPLDTHSLEKLKLMIGKFDQKAILNKRQDNLILLCARSKNPQIRALVKDCIDAGADSQSKNKYGTSLLHLACLRNDISLIKLLEIKKSDWCEPNGKGWTPFDLVLNENLDFLESLLDSRCLNIHDTLNNKIVWQEITKHPAAFRSLLWMAHDIPTEELKLLPRSLIKELIPALMEYEPMKLISILEAKVLTFNTVLKGKIFWHMALESENELLCNWMLEHLDQVDVNVKNAKTDQRFLQGYFQLPVDYKLIKRFVFLGAYTEDVSLPNLFSVMKSLEIWTPSDDELFQKLTPRIKTLKPLLIMQWLKLYKEKKPSKFNHRLKLFDLSLLEFSFANKFTSITEEYKKEVNPFTKEDYIDELASLASYLSNTILNFNPILQELREDHKKNIEEAKSLLSAFNKHEDYSKNALQHAIMLCLSEKKYEYLEDLINCHQRHRSDPNNIVYHYLLDKMWTQTHGKDPFNIEQGSLTQINASALAENLRKMLETADQNIPQDLQQQITEIIKNCCYSLNLTAFIQELFSFENLTYENVIVELICNAIFPTLVPCGCIHHAASISVENTSRNTVRIELHNPGLGVSKHHHWLWGNRYQTSRIIENVPITNVLNPVLWKKIIESQQQDNIDYLYDLFDNQLGTNGTLVKASENYHDYEQIQMHGTCSAQNLMAFVRSQVLRKISGTALDKIGAYKLIKAGLATQIGKRYQSACNKEIENLLNLKLNKNRHGLALKELVNDHRFSQVYEKLNQVFEKLGNEFQIEWTSLKSFSSRYLFLRSSCQYFVSKKLEPITEFSEIKDYMISISLDKSFSLCNIKNLIEEYEAAQDWNQLASILGKLLAVTPYYSMAIEWFTKPENASAAKIVFSAMLKKSKIQNMVKIYESLKKMSQ